MAHTRYPIPGVHRHRVQSTISKSRFITTMAHAPTLEEAKRFIQDVQSSYRDATHNCWAFVAGPPGDTSRVGCSDDGEPRNTAGKPMLQALLYSGVGEIAAVVTRYFGGTKLGSGGLVRAYSGMVKLGLESLPLAEKIEKIRFRVLVEYGLIDRLQAILPDHDTKITAEAYATEAEFVLELPIENEQGLKQALAGISGGTLLVEPEGQPET